MKKVSIIVPVYNTEKYLVKCLESLVNQTLKDIEIILIDDGSTDRSYEIMSSYAKRYEHIIILQQENSKQGAARNRGLEIATGEFVTFVDSDDWIDLDYCELLYNAAIKHGVNIAAASATRDYKHKVKKHLRFSDEKTFYGANDIVKGLEQHLETHSKLYRFEFIKDLRFEENVFYEDAPYTLRAICREGSMVSVPDAHYHYYSNPNSTMKQKLSIKYENDKISTNLELIAIAEENNVDIGDWLVIKKDKILTKIKYYKNHVDYYLFGLKIITKNEVFDNRKAILVFNTACFGDVLLCNSLCQNIKKIFPESKLVFITDKAWSDVAKYQYGVDEVIVYDKKGKHKGFGGMFKFIKEFPYKKPFVSFITYKNERNISIAKLLKSRFVIVGSKKKDLISTQWKHSLLIQELTHKKVKNYPLLAELPSDVPNPLYGEKYIALCTTTKRDSKDIPIDTANNIINYIVKNTDNKIALVGAGAKAKKYAEELKTLGCDFIDMTDKTSIAELGALLKDSQGLISADTGTMHYGYSLKVPTVAVFYDKNFPTEVWAPNKNLYNVEVIEENQSADNILIALSRIGIIKERVYA